MIRCFSTNHWYQVTSSHPSCLDPFLVLLGLLCMKLGFLAQDREDREGKGGRYGRITRNHARNDDYPHDKEMGA